ncbi:T9SS type A sorting domain-containing protein [Algibacter sp. 2305UL17-15]|uniref:T9SS type A sorting domain-containing protein n=1 Tax=Algibacter sp. 2305UL17-15 TaxID=3231268 RepID=UPI003459EA85
MRKQLLLINFLFLTHIAFSQSSGTFTGQVTTSDNEDLYQITAPDNGVFEITLTSTPNGASATLRIPPENYIIGSLNTMFSDESTITNCVETNQTIDVIISKSSPNAIPEHGYTFNYTFIPITYSTDSEPNNTFTEAISTIENNNYDGWFNNGSQTNSSNIDDTDWYKFTAPRNGTLTIEVKDGNEFADSPISALFNSNDLSVNISPSSVTENGLTTTYSYNNFDFQNQEFGIRLQSNCVSYQLSWSIQSTATTTIIDVNFEQLLVDLGYDDVVDGSVLTQNIESVTTLDISSMNISDLTGIEDFTALVSFTSIQNPLTNVDFSNNLDLEIISIINNPISSIDVSQNTNLTELTVSTQTFLILDSIDVSTLVNLTLLELGANNLSSIDVSNNTLLTYLNVGNNPISNLDISNNLVLESIGIYSTSIADLNLSNHPNIQSVLCYNGLLETLNLQNGNNFSRNPSSNQVLTTLDVTNNPNLLCIQVDNVASAESNPNWQKDTMAVYSVDCAVTLSINSNDVSSSIIIYPNPVKDNLTIEYFDTIKKIEIYNIIGKKIKSIEQPNNSISMNEIKSGIYFFKIGTNSGIATKKVIKN